MKLIFIRHAEPDYPNNTLTEKGFKEAKLLGEYYSDNDFDYIFCSPLNRARLTCNAVIKKKEIKICDWMEEFRGMANIDGNFTYSWDFKPTFIEAHPELESDCALASSVLKGSNVQKEVELIFENFDKILEEHGYKRLNKKYKIINGNQDTLVFFCHGCLIAVLMSRIMNTSYLNIIQNSISLPTGVTTFISEEREEGYASFRMISFSDLTHLKIKGEKPSTHGVEVETKK